MTEQEAIRVLIEAVDSTQEEYDEAFDMAINTLKKQQKIKEDGFSDHLLNMGYTKGYCKAVDDFSEIIKERYSCFGYIEEMTEDGLNKIVEQLNKKISEFVLEHKDNLDFASGISVAWNMVDEIAEQMKAGE